MSEKPVDVQKIEAAFAEIEAESGEMTGTEVWQRLNRLLTPLLDVGIENHQATEKQLSNALARCSRLESELGGTKAALVKAVKKQGEDEAEHEAEKLPKGSFVVESEADSPVILVLHDLDDELAAQLDGLLKDVLAASNDGRVHAPADDGSVASQTSYPKFGDAEIKRVGEKGTLEKALGGEPDVLSAAFAQLVTPHRVGGSRQIKLT